MPELPEVETIRTGLAPHIIGQVATDVTVWAKRTARNQVGGTKELERAIQGRKVLSLARRGKFLWAQLDDAKALVFHLGMSGQLRINEAEYPRIPHEHARIVFADSKTLSFVDQRTFGRMEVVDLVPTTDNLPAGWGATSPWVPSSAAHIARDPLDEAFDRQAVIRRIRLSQSKIKNLLLNQQIVSGIGNIYADEALFTAHVHGERIGRNIRIYELDRILEEAANVMRRAIEVGGTSFDALYVNTSGEPGYFARSLAVYGRAGKPCIRCSTPIERVKIAGRTHHFCPVCQPRSRPFKN